MESRFVVRSWRGPNVLSSFSSCAGSQDVTQITHLLEILLPTVIESTPFPVACHYTRHTSHIVRKLSSKISSKSPSILSNNPSRVVDILFHQFPISHFAISPNNYEFEHELLFVKNWRMFTWKVSEKRIYKVIDKF